jgi:hypothetical protein
MTFLKRKLRKENTLYLVYFALIIWMLFNTGIFSDEFELILDYSKKNFIDILSSKDPFINAPLLYFSHGIALKVSSINNLFILYSLKTFYIILSFYFISKFFKIYLDSERALLLSFLFLFFPSHESTTYMFLAQYLTLTIALYLYSYYLAYNNKLVLAFFTAVIASFISYGSPVIAFSLFVLFLLRHDTKKGAVILIPNLIYILYYIVIVKILAIGEPSKLPEDIDLYAIFKQFILQILTFMDAVLGPSMWLKIFYSFTQLSAISTGIGCLFIGLFYLVHSRFARHEEPVFRRTSLKRFDPDLIICFTILMISSFLMFAVTGRYPQMAFNIGNKTGIFASMLVCYLIVAVMKTEKVRIVFLAVLILSSLGISDHWKNWMRQQNKLIKRISSNQQLKDYNENKFIFVSGNQYSKYGPISHIEFLSEHWVVNAVFRLALKKDISALPINKRHKYMDGYFVDSKHKSKIKVDDYINIYDSKKNVLFKLDVERINDYIESLPQDNRHWLLITNNRFLKDIVLALMPRLNYAF